MRMPTFVVALGLAAVMSAPTLGAHAQADDSLWTIRGGSYHGVTIPVDRSIAALEGRFWRLTNVRGERRVVGWNPSRLPAAVAFRRNARVTSPDSAAFWSILRTLEADIGMRLFKPATLTGDDDPDDVIVVDVRPMSAGPGLTLVTWSTFGSIYDARVFVGSHATLRNERVVAHEMMHALGFGHTSAWFSLMNPAAAFAGRVTAEDVAYIQAALASRSVNERGDMLSGLVRAALRAM